MDQVGGLLGRSWSPACSRGAARRSRASRWAFVILAAPAAISVAVLLRARRLYPDPRAIEGEPSPDAPAKLGLRYRIYLFGVALVAIGLADWPLLAFHLEKAGVLRRSGSRRVLGRDGADGLSRSPPACGSIATARAAAPARSCSAVRPVGAAYGLFVFASDATSRWLAIIGIAMWSVSQSATDSIGKAMIAALVPRGERGRAYGPYYLVFGLAWWAGSLLLGALYDNNHLAAGITSTAALVAGAAVVMWSGWRVKSA